MLQSIDPITYNALEQLAEFTSRSVFSYDVDNNRFTYLNSAFKQIWGESINIAAVNPHAILETIHPEDREYVIKNYQKIINSGEGNNLEFRIQLPDKNVKWLFISAVMNEQPPQRRIIAGSIEDRTAMNEKTALLKKAIAKRGSILEILAHDLAGPLNNINGLSSLLIEECIENQNPEHTKMLRMIAKTSERSIRLIREFVAQEFLESTTVGVIKRRVNIVEKLREIINQYRSCDENMGKTFNLFSSNENIYIKIDSFKFIQVINNLISNSIKFTQDGGVINLRIEEKEEDVLITVEDNGIGIPVHLQGDLFEKFTKARRHGIKGEPSTGLGMSIVKTIIEWHNGKIWFESEESKGTSFFIELPKE